MYTLIPRVPSLVQMDRISLLDTDIGSTISIPTSSQEIDQLNKSTKFGRARRNANNFITISYYTRYQKYVEVLYPPLCRWTVLYGLTGYYTHYPYCSSGRIMVIHTSTNLIQLKQGLLQSVWSPM